VYPTPQGWKHPLSFERHPIRIDYPEAEKTTIGSTPVFFIPDNELPLVDLTLLVKAGEVDLDPSLNGLGAIINGSLIDGGTELHAPEELARILDENAIEMSVSVNEEETVITLSVLKEDWRKGLDLLREVLTRPLFDPRVVAVVKEQTLIGLKRRGEDAQAVAMREAMIRHFQGHPYGRDPMLGLKTIPEIGPNDLRGFLRTYVVPSNIVIAVSGDISKDEVTDGLSLLLAALPQSRPPQRRIGDPDPTRPVLALIDKPGQVQSQVILMLPGVKRSDPDFWKLRLLADIFGGSDSLMYTRLRDDLGLVYSAGFFQMYKWHAGMLVGYIGCKADQTGTAIEETLGIMNELHRRVPKAEAERKRLEALNSFVFNVDSPNALANTYARYRMRGEPLDTLEKIQETYLATSEKDLHRLATDFLVPERVQIFVVADKSVSVGEASGGRSTLDETLKRLAAKLDLAFEEIALR
jgi:zinc protease